MFYKQFDQQNCIIFICKVIISVSFMDCNCSFEENTKIILSICSVCHNMIQFCFQRESFQSVVAKLSGSGSLFLTVTSHRHDPQHNISFLTPYFGSGIDCNLHHGIDLIFYSLPLQLLRKFPFRVYLPLCTLFSFLPPV